MKTDYLDAHKKVVTLGHKWFSCFTYSAAATFAANYRIVCSFLLAELGV